MAACSGRNPLCSFIPILLILVCITLTFPPASAADPFTDPGRWEYFNLTTVHPALKAGYAGGTAHGNYVYYVPTWNGSYHGWMVRYDTTKSFTSAPSWEYFNLQTVNASLRSFFGGAAHGNFVYYVPYHWYYGWNVVRYDTTKPFTSPAAWSWFNLSRVNVNLKGYCGAAVSGDYVYLAPRFNGDFPHGNVVRYDTTQEFTSPSAWSFFDMTTVNAALVGYEGAVTVGDHVYFIPFTHTDLTGYNTTMGFTDPAAWSSLDVTTVDPGLASFEGGAAQGRYLFPSPASNAIAARYDTAQDITSPSAYSTFNLLSLNPNLGGYLFNDALGDFVYYAPASTPSGWAARYNTSQEFTSPSAWSYYNMTTLNSTLSGFFSCVGSGNHVYFIPFRWVANYPGLTARFYALTAPGASFTASPQAGTAPLSVTFTDASVLSPASWAWDFGDGGTSTLQNPAHTYGSAGTYTVSLTVTNAEGSDTMTRTGYVTVSAPSTQTGSLGGRDATATTSASAAGRVKAGEEIVLPFRNRLLPVVSITLSLDQEAAEVLVTEEERSLPAGIPAPGLPVHRYLDIGLYHAPDDAVTAAVIVFRVPRSWVSSQQAVPHQVALLRYHPPAWEELPTEFLREEEGFLYYRAVTPGFSLFAIGVNLSREAPGTTVTTLPEATATTPPDMPRETPTPPVSREPTPMPLTPGPTPPAPPAPSLPVSASVPLIFGVAAVVLAVAGLLLWRRPGITTIRRKR